MMLLLGGMFNFGNTGDNYLPLVILVSISGLGKTQNGCLLSKFCLLENYTRSDERSN